MTDDLERLAKQYNEFIEFVMAAFVDLHVRYRALIETLEKYEIVPRERFEADVEAYRREHAEVLIAQAKADLKRLQDATAPPHESSG